VWPFAGAFSIDSIPGHPQVLLLVQIMLFFSFFLCPFFLFAFPRFPFWCSSVLDVAGTRRKEEGVFGFPHETGTTIGPVGQKRFGK
jgi:hypothetical protein